MSTTATSPLGGRAVVEVSRERALRAELVEQNAALRDRQVALTEQVAALVEQVAELRRRLDQNPRNSHRPPASEGYAKPAPRSRRERTDRSSGGQPGHAGATLCQVPDPAERVRHHPSVCAGCGAALADAPVVSTERRQVFDLPETRPAGGGA